MPRRPRPPADETGWVRQLVVGVAALLAVALVIGGVFSVLALSAAKVSGLGETSSRPSAEPSVVIPTSSPTASASAPSPTPTVSASPTPTKPPAAFTLTATPSSVAAGGRIVLAGTAQVDPGVRLQVQRFEGSWVDFPVTVGVTAGRYNTYITTSRTGPTRLRVVVPGTTRASNVARVTIG